MGQVWHHPVQGTLFAYWHPPTTPCLTTRLPPQLLESGVVRHKNVKNSEAAAAPTACVYEVTDARLAPGSHRHKVQGGPLA